MPLTFIKVGQSASIKAVLGKDETRRFLGSLGFTAGESVTVVSENGGNLILSIKDSRIALDRSMAQRIQV
ncbi:MAG TPA: ferrous iron transport protein A [Sphaerochaeta sp.]|nr:MAG: iron transporter FeoA [Spirochaetes bacterium GWC2_52_13]OHD66606.1 MAG: iron transporter FeoA [Spirochaetes bacterium GWF2_52_7]PKL19668.1 MAG: ferrous iron transport protein A [Spirochaetae bacterium HGW-Spirochaetae-4]HCG63488.1 ferrous iron transport protein A [Sphaerochaeta sp.]HCJ94836.1 ferrous iron transport protein A [Sphaerochaeta sp.]